MAFCPFPAFASLLERKQSAGATTVTHTGDLVLTQPTMGLEEHLWAALVAALFYVNLSVLIFLSCYAVKKCMAGTFWKAQEEMLKEVLATG